MATETLTEIISLGGRQFSVDPHAGKSIAERIVEEEERDRATGKPKDADNDADKSKSSYVPEPSMATREMMKALPDEMRNLIEEYRRWLAVVITSPALGSGERAKKIDELLLDYFLKASKLPAPETVESRLRQMACESGVEKLLTENIAAAVARMVANGDHDAPRKAIADLVEVCRKCGIRGDKPLRDPVDFANVTSYADAISALRS